MRRFLAGLALVAAAYQATYADGSIGGEPGVRDTSGPPLPGPRPNFRSDLVLPVASFFVPGLGQYFQGEVVPGLAYTTVAFGGVAMAAKTEEAYNRSHPQGPSLDENSFPKHWTGRRYDLGLHAYTTAGFLSAYGAFRTALPAFHATGDYLFLKPTESLGEMLLAPARVSLLKRPTTYVPLGFLAAVAGAVVYYYRDDRAGARWLFSGDDLLFAGAVSYNAGLSEEAAFRGYLLPLAHEYTGGKLFPLANTLQAALFSAAHYSSDNRVPVAQFLLGYYEGYLVRRNGWTLSESIFQHFWWDAILITSAFLTLHEARVSLDLSLPVAW